MLIPIPPNTNQTTKHSTHVISVAEMKSQDFRAPNSLERQATGSDGRNVSTVLKKTHSICRISTSWHFSPSISGAS